MLRTQNLFAFAAMGLLAFGLLASQFGSLPHLTFGTQNHGYAFSSEMPFYCIAALFAAFAFLYSIGYIPFSATMARWHFWLSLLSVLICFAGAVIFHRYASRITGTADTQLGPGGMLLAASFAAGLLTFVSMQLWFTVDLARALFKMRAT
jgi:hypothetical protein